MYLGVKAVRERIASNIEKALESDMSQDVKSVLREWLENKDESEGTRERAEKVKAALKNEESELA